MNRCAPLLLSLLMSAGLVACGDGSDGDGNDNGVPGFGEQPDGEGRVLPQPEPRAVAPGEVAVGDTLTILGEGFIAPPWGHTEVRIRGTFIDSLGTVLDVDFTQVPDFRRTSMLTMAIEGITPPSGFGHDVGVLTGELTLENISMDGNRRRLGDAPLPIEVSVGPSLVFDQVSALGAGCKERVTATIEEQRIDFLARATGLGEASTVRPIVFTWLFFKPTSDISLLDAFALSEDVEAGAMRDHESVQIHVDVVTNGSSSQLSDLRTWAVPGEAQNYKSSVFVRAQNADGFEVESRYEFDVRRATEVLYDGNQRPIRTFDPVPVSGCLSGGPLGTSVSYSENQSESRSRSFKVGASVNVGAKIKEIVSLGFGFDVGTSVSSSASVGESLSLNGRLLPGQFGVFYRQTTELAREGRVFANSVCGGREDLGEVVVTDWAWAPDLALSADNRCPPFPPSNLPPGREFE